MRRFHILPTVSLLSAALAICRPASAQPEARPIELVVRTGTPLRIIIERRTTVKRVGQEITAALADPVFVYDREVLPVGTQAIGHVERLEKLSRGTHVRAILAGDFTPPRRVIVQFDTLALRDGRRVPIDTLGTEGLETGAREKGERFKVAAIRALPYHPRILPKGTVYAATLQAPLDFGSAIAARGAASGATPVPESILHARLLTPVSSGTSAQGARIEAVLTRPVFSADGALILPEGTMLAGEVTTARRARSFHRHGQLRFLFETVQTPDREAATLLASLHSVETRQADRVTVDEEGGATSTSPKARFAAPALAALALAGSVHGRLDYDTDGLGPEMQYGGPVSDTAAGLLGLGLSGIGVIQLGRYATVATSAYAVVRTVYLTVFAKGREITFPKGTAIQVQLAPSATKEKR